MNRTEKVVFLSFIWPVPMYIGMIIGYTGNPFGVLMLMIAGFMVFINIIIGPLYLIYHHISYRRIYFLLALIVYTVMGIFLSYIMRLA